MQSAKMSFHFCERWFLFLELLYLLAGSHLQRAHRSAPEKQLYFTYGRMRASMRWISSGGI